MRIGNGRIRAFRCGDFGAQCRDLRFKRCPLRLAGKLFLLRCLTRFDRFRVTALDLLKLPECSNRDLLCASQRLGRERQAGVGLGAARIGTGEPVGKMKELAECGDGLIRLHGAGLVDGRVTEVLDNPRLGDDAVARDRSEAGFVNSGSKRSLERISYRAIMLINPVDPDLERQPGIKAGRAGI